MPSGRVAYKGRTKLLRGGDSRRTGPGLPRSQRLLPPGCRRLRATAAIRPASGKSLGAHPVSRAR